jgi:hypothetical protein
VDSDTPNSDARTSPGYYRGVRRLAPLVLLLGGGCRVVDAPDDFEDLVVFGFTTFDQDEAFPEATVGGLEPLLDSLGAQLVEGLRVNELTSEDLDAAGVDQTLEAGVIGSAATVHLAADVDGVAKAWTFPHMNEILENTLAFELTAEEGDRDCFLAHACETYAIEADRVLDMGLFGTATQVLSREFRWVTLEGSAPVLTVRERIPDGSEMSGDLVAVHQGYLYTAFFDRSGTTRLETIWIDAEAIGMDIPDTFALDFAVSAMQKTADQVDAWVVANP